METPTPVWLMDVDGVLNALRPDPSRHVITEACAEGRWFSIAYDPAVIHRLSRLHKDGVIEIRWLTTWCDDANRSLADAIGMPQLIVEGASRYRTMGYMEHRWWKEPAAHEVVRHDPSRMVIWSDDELDSRIVTGQVPWVSARTNVITITPDRWAGLTLDEVERVVRALTDEEEETA